MLCQLFSCSISKHSLVDHSGCSQNKEARGFTKLQKKSNYTSKISLHNYYFIHIIIYLELVFMSRSYSVIVWVRVVLKRTVVGDKNNSLFRTTLAKAVKHGCLLTII